jgi:hypothetical protein
VTTISLEARRHRVRCRALGNFTAGLMAQAARTGGRLRVVPGPDGVLLGFQDVRTLVRDGRGFAFAVRDFVVILIAPAAWPFAREAALRPMVVSPSDWANPHSNGVGICVELEGIPPSRVPEVVYADLTLRRHRLEHAVDEECVRFVRAHLDLLPTDPRPLFPDDAAARPGPIVADAPAAGAWTPVADDAGGLPDVLPVVRHAPGGLGLAAPTLASPTFLRLAAPAGFEVDAARRAYLRRAGAACRAAIPGWLDGPGLAVDPRRADAAVLRRELDEVALAVDALGDPRVAASYLAAVYRC